jgi:hypothetical protein
MAGVLSMLEMQVTSRLPTYLVVVWTMKPEQGGGRHLGDRTGYGLRSPYASLIKHSVMKAYGEWKY